MRSLRLIGALSMILLSLTAAPAFAAGPDHETIRGTATEPDFCGTGRSVSVTFKGVFNGWDGKATGHITNIWTNPDTGATVVDSFSGGGTFEVRDDGGGAYTIVSSRQGTPEAIKLFHGPMLTHDVGLAIFYDHFDADDNYLGTDVVVRGPHPGLESGFTLWCEVMIEALGL